MRKKDDKESVRMELTARMRAAGITPILLKTTKMLKCSYCGFEFNIVYSRAIACQGCPKAVYGCTLVRCPRCDHEFPINKSTVARTERSARVIGNYMSKLLFTYFRDYGKSPSR
jgi:hypothetical protein